jgi:putative peptidoglycan lipid II flippase
LGARRAWRDGEVRSLVGLSGWAAVQHAGTGVLLLAALLAGGGVAGGVVAYQFAMVVFLAPYGIISQPIHTAVLPRLAAEAQADDQVGLRGSVRWAADSMVAVTMPVAAILVAFSAPVMGVLAFGAASEGGGPELLGAALLGLAIGIPVYGGFLLLTRVAYALGNSRMPAVASMVVAILGAIGMAGAAAAADGPDRLALIGLAHTAAYALGALALALRLRSHVGGVWHVGQLWPAAIAVVTAGLAWAAMELWAPDGRLVTLVAIAVLGGLAMAGYALGLRIVGAVPPSGPGAVRPASG